jgi:hypothetical protein
LKTYYGHRLIKSSFCYSFIFLEEIKTDCAEFGVQREDFERQGDDFKFCAEFRNMREEFGRWREEFEPAGEEFMASPYFGPTSFVIAWT